MCATSFHEFHDICSLARSAAFRLVRAKGSAASQNLQVNWSQAVAVSDLTKPNLPAGLEESKSTHLARFMVLGCYHFACFVVSLLSPPCKAGNLEQKLFFFLVLFRLFFSFSSSSLLP